MHVYAWAGSHVTMFSIPLLMDINHSVRRANCRAEEVVDTDYSGPFAAVAVMAERDIAIGEELMFDCARRF